MSLSLLAGVTVHGEDSALSYAWSRLCDRDVQVAAHCAQLQRIDPTVDHPVAVRADAPQRARGVAGLDALGHAPCGHLRRAAWQAKDTARTAGLLSACPALGQEAPEFLA